MLVTENLDDRSHKPILAYEELRDVMILSLWAGQMLLQNGADTHRVEETVHRLGTALGADWMDIVVLPDSIIASTINNNEFRTKVRRAPMRGVDMQIIAEISHLSYQATEGKIDRFELRKELRRIDQLPRNYNRWLVVVAVGLACAAFSRLLGGDWPVFGISFLASSSAMFVRQELHHRHFNPLLIVAASSLVAGLIASSAQIFQLSPKASTAMAAAVLLLVPGVPLINAAEDLINGHLVSGVMRGIYGFLIVLMIALGLVIAIWLARVQGL
jgi:uncharacterized membrane protein YjjP (DUF1212 family)